MINISILGTSCMVPTKERNHSAIYAEVNGTGMLLDCGEGTQRQMNVANISRSKVRYIFISHWHADHTAGLLGLIQTISAGSKNPELNIYGPVGTKKFMEHLLQASVFENQIDLKVEEFDLPNSEIICKTDKFSVKAINLEHGTPCLGFSLVESDKRKMKVKELTSIGLPQGPQYAQLQKGEAIEFRGHTLTPEEFTTLQKGKKFTYIPDTLFTENAIELAKKSDLLLSEASYADAHEHKAEEYHHMTASQAAHIASASESKRLLITHFSQRYKDVSELVDEAKTIFPETSAAYDFMKISLK